VVNYMIADGLARAGQTEAAVQITASSLDLNRASSFAEYYDPHKGEPLGGGRFT
jgi:glycogen debranching enzyme